MEKTGVPCPMAVAAAPPPPNRFVLTRKSIYSGTFLFRLSVQEILHVAHTFELSL